MKTILIGNGYWGNIIKGKLSDITQLLYTADSKTNLDELLEKSDVDYVFICTPTKTHYDIVKKCIKNKKNIFCEKPFTGDINKAIELYELAEKYGVEIYVDNIFLSRDEFSPHINNHKNSTTFKFEWYKYEEKFKENLLHTLLYHDLYLLIEMTDDLWVVEERVISDNELFLKLSNKGKVSTFHYNRKIKGSKIKKITIDDDIIDFSNPKNNPLFEVITTLKDGDINLDYNKKVTMKTLKLLNDIKIL
tara:strand:- start:476 stop:1219 length:744 start_codon:yes stop_codon:yes gene_type:complete